MGLRPQRGVTPDVTIELGRDGGWWPIQRVDESATSVKLALDRLSRPKGTCCESWPAIGGIPRSRPVCLHLPLRASQSLRRYAGGGRFWVDLGETKGVPNWHIGGLTGKGPVVTVPQVIAGPVQLSVRVGQRVIKDERVIEVLGGGRVASRI